LMPIGAVMIASYSGISDLAGATTVELGGLTERRDKQANVSRMSLGTRARNGQRASVMGKASAQGDDSIQQANARARLDVQQAHTSQVKTSRTQGIQHSVVGSRGHAPLPSQGQISLGSCLPGCLWHRLSNAFLHTLPGLSRKRKPISCARDQRTSQSKIALVDAT
jgi:hypothetical protein